MTPQGVFTLLSKTEEITPLENTLRCRNGSHQTLVDVMRTPTEKSTLQECVRQAHSIQNEGHPRKDGCRSLLRWSSWPKLGMSPHRSQGLPYGATCLKEKEQGSLSSTVAPATNLEVEQSDSIDDKNEDEESLHPLRSPAQQQQHPRKVRYMHMHMYTYAYRCIGF